MSRPTEAYLVGIRGEWPIEVIVNDNEGIIANRVEEAVNRRLASTGGRRPDSDIEVVKVDLTNPRPVDFVRSHHVPASLIER